MNLVALTGRLVKDVEVKISANGTAVFGNTLAVQREYKNAEGEYESDFVNIVAFSNTAKFLADYSKKGDKISVAGRIQTRNYDGQDGKKVYVTEVVADRVEILTPKKEETKEEVKPSNLSNDPFARFGEANGTGIISDSDLPF